MGCNDLIFPVCPEGTSVCPENGTVPANCRQYVTEMARRSWITVDTLKERDRICRLFRTPGKVVKVNKAIEKNGTYESACYEWDAATGSWIEFELGGKGSELESSLKVNKPVGGIANNTFYNEGTPIEQILRDMLVIEIAPTMSVGLTPSAGLKEVGTSVTLTKVTINLTPNTASLVDTIDIYKGSSWLGTVGCTSATSYSFSTNTVISDTTAIKAVLNYKDSAGAAKTLSVSATYTFTRSSYFGALSTADDITEANILTLTKKLIGGKGTTQKFTTDNQLMVYAYPASFGDISSIVDTATGYSLTWTKTTVTIDGVKYNAYYSSIGKVTNYNVRFS